LHRLIATPTDIIEDSDNFIRISFHAVTEVETENCDFATKQSLLPRLLHRTVSKSFSS